jgi:nicotinamidase-related amidase
MRIRKENAAGLVIDIQERLVPVMMEKEQLLKNCRMLIEGLQALGVPVLVTQQYTKGLGMTVPELSAVIQEFSPVEKRDFSCCGEPAVMTELARMNARHVIICGIESHVCVLQTALDLKDAGYIPVVVVDAVSSRFPANLELARERFRHEGILMTSAESLLFELTESSAAPAFKAISKLVKG